MSEGTCDVNMFDNTGVIFRPPEKLREKLEKHYKEAMKFKFDDVFETNEEGQKSCKLEPEQLNGDDGEYQFTLHKIIQDISNQHRQILDEWCKAFLAKEYEIGNDIHPGCFTLEQREVMNPNELGWDYMIVPNDQNLGTRVKWNSFSEIEPPKDGSRFLAYVSICLGENQSKKPGIFMKDFRVCWFQKDHWRSSDNNECAQILEWMKIPEIPETLIKTPHWERMGWCCENLFNSTNKEYSVDSGYPENAPVLMGDDNSLFIGKIQERIKVCPWCGKEVNNG